MGKYIGIDLGTTFSAVAYVNDNGQAVVLGNGDGDHTTPSALFFDNNKVIVGKTAKEISSRNPENYVAFVKRQMGEKNFRFTTEQNQEYAPEELSAMILKKLVEDAENSLGDTVTGAVITVPAYFGDPERQATKDAANIAGIPLLGMINEPTAAALAFGSNKTVKKTERVLVYDLGGGTFDVSILEVKPDGVTVLATGGNRFLGGYDLDKYLYDYVIQEAEENGVQIRGNLKAEQQLMLQVESAKKRLGNIDSAEICINVAGVEYDSQLTADILEEAVYDVFDPTLSQILYTVQEANLSYSDLDKILLVGGSTKLSAISAMIENETGIKPSREVNPDEAVAIGAAYHSVNLAKTSKNVTSTEKKQLPPTKQNVKLKDVVSHGIGVKAFYPKLKKYVNAILIAKNTPIPAQVIKAGFKTKQPYQDQIQLEILQGDEKDIRYCTEVGKVSLAIKPRSEIVELKIGIKCDANSMIHVHAMEKDSGVILGEFTIDRSKHNMDQQEVKMATGKVSRLNIG